MPELEVFIEFEEALAGVVYREWEKAAKPVLPDIAQAVRNADSQTAEQIIHAINVDDAVHAKAKQLKIMMLAAMHFGADLIEPGAPLFKGKPEPDVLPSVLAAFEGSVSYSMNKLAAEQTQIVVAQLVEAETEGLYQVKKAEGGVEQALLNALLGNGSMMAAMNANLITSRLVNYGALAQMLDMGISTYALNATLDQKTSQVCRRMHGKTFEVKQAFDRMDQVLRITNPNELRSAAPWIKSSKASLKMLEVASSRDLAAMGFDVPPFHPSCRTIVSLVSQVIVTGQEYTPIVATATIMEVVRDLLVRAGSNDAVALATIEELIGEELYKPDVPIDA